MFEVRITAEAKRIIEHAIANYEGPNAGLMIHRVGPVGEVSRSAGGGAAWQIERRHPWAVRVGSYSAVGEKDENVVVVDGVSVWLPLIPRQGELGVVVTVHEGQLHVEAIDV
jgi:hypothetical protein